MSAATSNRQYTPKSRTVERSLFSRMMQWMKAISIRKIATRALLFLPTILAGIYYLGAASDQYESEARFVVRSAARPEVPGGMALLVQLGLARSQDDSFVVQEFMTSRDALERLQKIVPLREMYGRSVADFLARYPSILFGSKEEEFFKYYQHMVGVVHTDKTGISTIRVSAFEPTDAHNIASELLKLGEALVNQINQRIQTDAISHGLAELRTAQLRLIDAQAALTRFRNKELTIDPRRNAIALSELIAGLSAELVA